MLVVFGCGGDRDREKRPAMGAIAARLADVVVVTSDNPRSEDPLAIIDEIVAGAHGTATMVVEPDRSVAISKAVEAVGRGDVVVVAGKGHETSQQFADRAVAFDDRAHVLEALEAAPRGGGGPMISIFTSGGVAILVAGFGTPILLRWLVRWRIGQHIRSDGPAQHAAKAGTPTMGGIAMVAAVVGGYVLGHVGTAANFTRSGWLVVGAVVAAGAVGSADDWIKVSRRRSLGLNKRWKIGLLVAVAVSFAVLDDWAGVHTTLSFTRYDVPGVELGAVVWVIWATLIIVGGANAVNLTDGLDGLAAGSSTLVFTALALIGYWQFRHFGIYRIHATRSTSPWWRWRWPAPASASCGGTRRRPGSSWATPARSRSAPASPASRSR